VEPRRSSKCGAKEEQQVWSQGGAASVEPRRSSKCGAKEEQQVRKLRKSSKCRNAEITESASAATNEEWSNSKCIS
jgi:hypothetical protein